MSAGQRLNRLRNDQRGHVLALTAAAMPLVIGAGALAMDTIQLTLWKRQLQRAADSAAIAGVHGVVQGQPARDAALHDLGLNNEVPLTELAGVWNAPTTGAYRGNSQAVEVVLKTQRRLAFMSFFMSTPPTLTARAVATRVRVSEHCILALDTSDPEALQLNGNANIRLGCGMFSNSADSRSAVLTGNVKIEATALSAVGGIEVSGNTSFPENLRHAYSGAQTDPFGPDARNLQVPDRPVGCTANNLQIHDLTTILSPGRYCGFIDINGKADVTFQPGTYIVDGEFLKINGNAKVRGDGVTFILTGSPGDKYAFMHWDGNADIRLSAPKVSSGSPYAGVLVMSDPAAPNYQKHFLNGNLTLYMTGALYFPSSRFYWNGNTTGATRCLKIVARTIDINGNPNIPNQCNEGDGLASPTERVRLVE